MRYDIKAFINDEILVYFVKWSILSVIIGVFSGFFGSIFGLVIDKASMIYNEHHVIHLLSPVVAVFIVFFYALMGIKKSRGTNVVIEAISSGETVTPKIVPLIFVSSNLSHLVGASVGREGAALQMGAGIGSFVARILKFDEKDTKLLMMCSMAGCFSALFGTPITASIFCIELFSIGSFYMSALMPSMFASFVASAISTMLGLKPEVFRVYQVLNWNIKNFCLIIILAAISALVAVIFCRSVHFMNDFYDKYIPNQYLKVLLTSLLFVVLCMIIRTDIYNGSGIHMVSMAMRGELNNYAFFIKIIITALALSAGFKGGEIVPSLAIGASLGLTISRFLSIPVEIAVSLSLVAFFVGITNCPLASIFLALELFKVNNIYAYVLAIVTSFLLSGYYSIYGSQKFSYKKTGLEFLGKTSHSMVEKKKLKDNMQNQEENTKENTEKQELPETKEDNK